MWAPRRGMGWGMGEGIGRSRDAEYVFDLTRDPHETVNWAGAHGLALEAAVAPPAPPRLGRRRRRRRPARPRPRRPDPRATPRPGLHAVSEPRVTKLHSEAVKMRRAPGIVFADGPSGRRAVVAGSGLDVWEIMAKPSRS